jgi:hypothetical protein
MAIHSPLAWNLPEPFATSSDAALNGQGPYIGRAFLASITVSATLYSFSDSDADHRYRDKVMYRLGNSKGRARTSTSCGGPTRGRRGNRSRLAQSLIWLICRYDKASSQVKIRLWVSGVCILIAVVAARSSRNKKEESIYLVSHARWPTR